MKKILCIIVFLLMTGVCFANDYNELMGKKVDVYVKYSAVQPGLIIVQVTDESLICKKVTNGETVVIPLRNVAAINVRNN